MSDIVVDSCVVAKWVLEEQDSDKAEALLRSTATGNRLIVLDLVLPEVANAIWKRRRRGQIGTSEASALLDELVRMPFQIEPAAKVLKLGLEIAIQYDRAAYDSLFMALIREKQVRGVTADEPLFNAVHRDFPQLVLLKDL